MISCRNLSLKARSLSYSSRAVVPPEFPDLNDILTTPTGSWIPSSCLPTPSPNNLPPNSVLTRPCLEFVLSFLSPPPTPGIRTHFGSAEVLQPPPHSSPALGSYCFILYCDSLTLPRLFLIEQVCSLLPSTPSRSLQVTCFLIATSPTSRTLRLTPVLS